MAEMIGIPDIAKRLGVDGGTVRRLIARENETLQLTINRGKGDRFLLSKDDADRLIASYEARRGPVAEVGEDSAKFDRYGYFYVIQLVPEALPNRVKIGFADNVEKRLSEHKTAARSQGYQFRPETMRLMLNTDPHPLPKYRANATLQNIPESSGPFNASRATRW